MCLCACVSHVYVYSFIIVWFMDECELLAVPFDVIDFSWFGGVGQGVLPCVVASFYRTAPNARTPRNCCLNEVYGYDVVTLPRVLSHPAMQLVARI